VAQILEAGFEMVRRGTLGTAEGAPSAKEHTVMKPNRASGHGWSEDCPTL